MNIPIDWLLEGEPWIEYRTRRDLLGQSEQDPLVRSARSAMLANAQVHNLFAELSGWPGTVISSHKSASQPFHKLTFSADLGLRIDDPGMAKIVARILADHTGVSSVRDATFRKKDRPGFTGALKVYKRTRPHSPKTFAVFTLSLKLSYSVASGTRWKIIK